MTTNPIGSIKILILEDEYIFAQALQKDLASIGYNQTTVVSNSHDFAQAIENDSFQLIFLDIDIQEKLNGLDLAERHNLRTKAAFIVLSNLTRDSLIDKATKLGVSAYLTKGCQAKQLGISIRRIFGNPDYQLIRIGSQNACFQKGHILAISAFGHLSYIHLLDGRRIPVNHKFTSVAKKIDYPSLIRVSKSYFININLVSFIKNNKIKLPFPIKRHGEVVGKDHISIGKAYQSGIEKHQNSFLIL